MNDWETICHEHGEMVWTTVYRIVHDYAAAEDCCQIVFLEAWQRSSREPIVNVGAFLRWLSVHRAIDVVRRRRLKVEQNTLDRYAMDSVALHDGPRSPVELDELMECLVQEMASLPTRQADAFWLRAVEDRPYSEIAKLLATNKNEVGVLIHRAKESLRVALSEFDPSHL